MGSSEPQSSTLLLGTRPTIHTDEAVPLILQICVSQFQYLACELQKATSSTCTMIQSEIGLSQIILLYDSTANVMAGIIVQNSNRLNLETLTSHIYCTFLRSPTLRRVIHTLVRKVVIRNTIASKCIAFHQRCMFWAWVTLRNISKVTLEFQVLSTKQINSVVWRGEWPLSANCRNEMGTGCFKIRQKIMACYSQFLIIHLKSFTANK